MTRDEMIIRINRHIADISNEIESDYGGPFEDSNHDLIDELFMLRTMHRALTVGVTAFEHAMLTQKETSFFTEDSARMIDGNLRGDIMDEL